MTHKFSRSEKEKWIAGTPKPKRRGPVPIPPSNNQDLIDNNKLSLIGRVVNPQVQKPKALLEFMLHHWEIEDRAVGRELGPSLFLIRFQEEDDLTSILNKALFHYKRWMFILQRWEPIVSDFFPAFIPFWIEVQGIPLHHWSDQTLRTIGLELGFVIDRDVDLGKIRVRINALEPLEMSLPIQLPTGEVTTVNLVYEKLEKHCFLCFSLSHEERDCPTKEETPAEIVPDTGINQRRTLFRNDADRRKQSSRRDYQTENRERRNRALEPCYRGNRDFIRHSPPRPSRRSPPTKSQSSHDYPHRVSSRDHERHHPYKSRDPSPRSSHRDSTKENASNHEGSRYHSLSDHLSARNRAHYLDDNEPFRGHLGAHLNGSRGQSSPRRPSSPSHGTERMVGNGSNYPTRGIISPTGSTRPNSNPTSLICTPILQATDHTEQEDLQRKDFRYRTPQQSAESQLSLTPHQTGYRRLKYNNNTFLQRPILHLLEEILLDRPSILRWDTDSHLVKQAPHKSHLPLALAPHNDLKFLWKGSRLPFRIQQSLKSPEKGNLVGLGYLAVLSRVSHPERGTLQERRSRLRSASTRILCYHLVQPLLIIHHLSKARIPQQ